MEEVLHVRRRTAVFQVQRSATLMLNVKTVLRQKNSAPMVCSSTLKEDILHTLASILWMWTAKGALDCVSIWAYSVYLYLSSFLPRTKSKYIMNSNATFAKLSTGNTADGSLCGTCRPSIWIFFFYVSLVESAAPGGCGDSNRFRPKPRVPGLVGHLPRVSYVRLVQCPPLGLAVTSGHQLSLRAGLRGLQRKTQLRGRVRDK